jgi:hypothetical protein
MMLWHAFLFLWLRLFSLFFFDAFFIRILLTFINGHIDLNLEV